MIQVAIVCVLALVFPNFAFAAGLKVQSGEHEGFTRLVLPLPPSAQWQVRKARRSVEIRVFGKKADYDTSQVFQRIPKRRITSIQKDEQGSSLRLALACDCPVSSFVEAGKYLVVDVSDPIAPPPVWGLLPSLAGNTPLYRFSRPEARKPAASIPQTPDHGETPKTRRSDPKLQDTKPLLSLQLAELPQTETWRLNLYRHIRTAIESGLLAGKPAMPPTASVERRVAKAETETRLKHKAEARPDQERGHMPSLKDHASVETIKDRIAPDRAKTRRAKECLDAELVDVGAWAKDGDFHAQAARIVSRLFSDTGKLSRQEAISLARLYVSFGLAKEAEVITKSLPHQDPAVQAVMAMIAILQNDHNGAEYFSGRSDCGAEAAMWAMIAGANDVGDIDRKAVLRSFSKLPAQLRELVGPRLASRFAQAGMQPAANLVWRILDSGHISDPQIEIAEGNPTSERAHGRVAETVAEGAQPPGSLSAANALMQLVERKWRERSAVPTEVAELAASFSFEFRGSPMAGELVRTEATAFALSGDFPAAMRKAGLEPPFDFQGKSDAETRRRVLTLLTERADDMTFLEYVLPLAKSPGITLTQSVGHAIVKRLRDLGFADAATELLAKTRTEDRQKPRNWPDIGATGHLAKNSHGVAEDTEPVQHEVSRGTDPAEKGPGSDHLTTDAGKAVKLAGEPASQPQHMMPPPLPPLASVRQLLRESQTARAEIQSLLSKPKSR